MIQEHWLLNYEGGTLSDLFPECMYSIKSVDDGSPDLPLYRRRGNAGTAAVWKKEIDHLIEPIHEGSDRTLLLQVVTEDTPLLIINSYMPTMGSKDPEYGETLDEIGELLRKYAGWNIIWTGDLNADTQRNSGYPNDKQLADFMEEHQLQINEKQADTPTYHHFNGRSTSRLDVFIERRGNPMLEKVSVDERHPINTSAHDAITATVTLRMVAQEGPVNPQDLPPAKPRIRWDRVDLLHYREKTTTKLECLLRNIEDTPLDVNAEMINNILERCAVDASPPIQKKTSKRKRPWTPKMKDMVRNIKKLHFDSKQSKEQNSETIAALKTAKKILRRTQRQVAAKRRNDTKMDIMRACRKKDRRDFYNLVRKQRRITQPNGSIQFGSFKEKDTPNSWAKYFQHLATPKNDTTFDDDYGRHLKLMHLLFSLNPRSTGLPMVREDQVAKYVKELGNGKAPDVYGVASEHIKMAGPVILKVICHLCNQSMDQGKLPLAAKVGLLTPVLKKGKSAKDPNSYRRITISSLVGKIIEKHILIMTDSALANSHSPLQFGFTKGCSPLLAALIITEIMAEAKDSGQLLLITFMDSSKAFDVVNHQAMLKALFQQGVEGKLWELFNDMYSGIRSTVKWEGLLSSSFTEKQGIRQGGITSPLLYKAGRNKGLEQLDKNPSMQIGCINTGAVMVADDLALTAATPQQMQLAIYIAQEDASRERYLYNTEKTKTLVINGRSEDICLQLNGKPLGISTKEKHLGIFRNSKNSNSDTVNARISESRRACYSLLGAGLCGLNGTGPEVATSLYKTYIIPLLVYGLESLVLQEKEIQTLEAYHRRNLRHLLHLPASTATPAIYLLSGCPPLEAEIHVRTLLFFRSIAEGRGQEGPLDFVNSVIERQLALKGMDSSSWTAWVRRILLHYGLPNAFDVLRHPPEKTYWRKMVRSTIYQHWTDLLLSQKEQMSSLAYLKSTGLRVGLLHQSLTGTETPVAIQKVAVATKLITGRYPLANNRTAGKRFSNRCPLCEEEEEDQTHFLLHCRNLSQARKCFIFKILQYCRENKIDIEPVNLTALIIDPVGNGHPNLKVLVRNMIFSLHNSRCSQLHDREPTQRSRRRSSSRRDKYH